MKKLFYKLISLSFSFAFAVSLLACSANAQTMTRAVEITSESGEHIGYTATADEAAAIQQKLDDAVKTGRVKIETDFKMAPLSAVECGDKVYESAVESLSDYESGYGLYVDGKLTVAAQSSGELLDAVSEKQLALCNEYGSDDVEITNDIQIVSGLFGTEYVSDDAGTAVASMSFSSKGIKYRTEKTEIAYNTDTVEDSTHESGYEKKVSGENGVMETVYKTEIIDGKEQAETKVSSTVVKQPINAKLIIGTAPKSAQVVLKAASKSSSGSSYKAGASSSEKSQGMVWPVNKNGSNSYISCNYGEYSGHSGVDIAAYKGTAIYAVKAGKVVLSEYHHSYGNQIVIEHSDGTRTRYAHCSALYVSVGDTVTQGQNIAAVGETGNATGPHLHFEVIVNGSAVNPRSYLGY